MENEGRVYCHSENGESPSEKSFTIIWKIENSEYFYQAGYKLQSPVVFVDVMERTSWRLELYRLQPHKYIYVTIKREAVDHGPEKFDLHYDFDIYPIEKEAPENKSRSHAFQKDESGPPILLKKGNLLVKSENSFQSHNIAIRCVMKKNNGPISMSGQCIALTRIGGEFFEFIEKMNNFSSLTPGAKRTLKVLSSSTDERLMTVHLRMGSGLDKSIVLDFFPTVEKGGYSYIFSSTILDWSGNETFVRESHEYTLQKAETLELCTKDYLENYADYYLPNDTLNLLCKTTICTGIKSEEIENIGYETDVNYKLCSSLDLETSKQAGTSSSSFDYDAKFLEIPSVLDDFTAFYNKGILCDAKLQTATETFPAHKAILSARSPVFEAMFTSNMKEKIKECVRIDDVDAETMKRMLLFLYSDSLEDLEWRDAKKLYFAADKYQVLSLKLGCAEILKESIDLSSCCELLLLADMHQDEDLKAFVQNFIARYDKEVFLSAQWRDMEKSHPHLAIDILRTVHLKHS